MESDKKPSENTTSANDNVSTNAHYTKKGEILREDSRDLKDSIEDWNAEQNRTGRHK